MVKSMFLGLAAVALASGVSSSAVAQDRLAAAVDVAPIAPSARATQGWTACVTSYIRSHAAEVRDPDDAADAAFSACRALQVSLRPGDEPRPVYARDDGSDQATRYSLLTTEARVGAGAH